MRAAPRFLALLLVIVISATARAADPGAALNKAREEITAGNHAAALRLLREATPGVAAMTDLKKRSSALSAIHFYSALAASGMGDASLAATELRAFFLYSPGAKLDTSRFKPEFASLFNEVQKKVTDGRATPASFDDAYPGYPPMESSSVWPLLTWGASSEFIILATEEERDQWGRLRDDATRRTFVDAFWKSRDPEPDTSVNEARIEFLRRIAFADVAFPEANDDRGSLTDRGRVFVLFGPPQRVSVRPMNRREAWYQPRRTIDAGNAIEQWTYFRDQLPKKMPYNEIVIRFITEGGSLIRKMERDFTTEKALRDAPAALRH